VPLYIFMKDEQTIIGRIGGAIEWESIAHDVVRTKFVANS